MQFIREDITAQSLWERFGEFPVHTRAIAFGPMCASCMEQHMLFMAKMQVLMEEGNPYWVKRFGEALETMEGCVTGMYDWHTL